MTDRCKRLREWGVGDVGITQITNYNVQCTNMDENLGVKRYGYKEYFKKR